MPNTKTAKKALRQNARHYQKNLKNKKELKEAIKKFRKMAAEYKAESRSELRSTIGEKAKKELSAVYKKLDKSAKIDLIKKNKASRLKSRLAKSLVKSS